MKVKLTVAMTGERAWESGDEFECDTEEATRLIEAGYAVPIADAKVERAVKPLGKEAR
jgi:hypothetical protein